ncbi:LOW QUALITY PROTEIN: hypothetical protein HID58_043099 [Brassica napus]|uniref:Uncharacterized protein n=1 Tax=Brassica napus TaxID=3708 RepID=A0ABQ8BFK9_BRANA|nr:LOW QUALITY PROTEIN: hypothetical protein HID58_043099 [Brassica napus]
MALTGGFTPSWWCHMGCQIDKSTLLIATCVKHQWFVSVIPTLISAQSALWLCRRSLPNAQIIVALCLAAAIDDVEDPYPTQHTAIDKFMVYKLIKTSGSGVIKRILTLSAPKRSPVSRCKKMVLRFLLQLYQEVSTDCLSLFSVHCNNTNVVGVVRDLPLTLNTCFLTSRYRVEMTIADDTADGLFFDGIMTKLHNIITYETGHLLAGEGVNPEETQVPPFIAHIVVKTYTF